MTSVQRLAPLALLVSGSAFAAPLVPTTIVPAFTSVADENLQIRTLAALGEARVGDRSVGGATYELDVQDHSRPTFSNATDLVTAQKAWANNTFQNFTLSYAAATKTLTFNVNGVSVSQAQTNDEVFTDMWIRTFAQGSRNLTTSLANLKLTTNFGTGTETRDLAIAAHAAPYAGNDGSALHITTGSISNTKDWALAGDLAFGWLTAADASQSRAAVQFKVGTPVPEPASMAVLGVGLAAFRRRRTLRK